MCSSDLAKLGFERAVVPKSGPQRRAAGLPVTEIGHLRDLLPLFGIDGGAKPRRARDMKTEGAKTP